MVCRWTLHLRRELHRSGPSRPLLSSTLGRGTHGEGGVGSFGAQMSVLKCGPWASSSATSKKMEEILKPLPRSAETEVLGGPGRGDSQAAQV